MLVQSTKKKIVIAAVFVILAIAAVLRVHAFSGFVGLDDAEYARFAFKASTGEFTFSGYQGPAVFPLRVGVIFPAAAFFTLFGVSEWSMVLYPFLLSLLCLVLVFATATHFFNSRTGIIAAALWAVLPIELNNSTRLLPDLPSAFFSLASVAGLLYADSANKAGKTALFAGGVISGVSLGFAWLCKESIIYLFPFLAFLMVMNIRKDATRGILIWSGAAAGSLGIFLSEAIIYWNMTGDLLFRLHEMERNYQQWKNGFFTEGSKFGWSTGASYTANIVNRLFSTGPKAIFLNGQFLYAPLIGIAAALYAFVAKDRRFLIPSVWLLSVAFMFNFASSSTSTYLPLALFNRYMYLIVAPAVVLAAGFFDRVFHNRTGMTLRFLIIAVFLICSHQAYLGIKYSKVNKGWSRETQKASEHIRPTDPLYTDILSLKGLEFFWGYPKTMNAVDFEGENNDAVANGAFVFLNPKAVDWLKVNAGMWLSKDPEKYNEPSFIKEVPASWTPVWHGEKAVLYKSK